MKKIHQSLVLLLVILLCACQQVGPGENIQARKQANLNQEEVKEAQIARLFFVGDVIYHYPVYKNLARNENPTQFRSHYELMEPYIQGADFALANYEGSVSPDGQTHSYPMVLMPYLQPTTIAWTEEWMEPRSS